MPNKQKRLPEIDIMKGLLIILMVYAHIHLPGVNFIYLFHMPVFFIISACFIKIEDIHVLKDVFNFIKKRIKTLWLPYFMFNTIFMLLNNFLLKNNILSNSKTYKEIFPSGNTSQYLTISQMFNGCIYHFFMIPTPNYSNDITGATWFLAALFYSSFFLLIMTYFFNKLKLKINYLLYHLCIGILLEIIIYILNRNDLFFLGSSLLKTFLLLYTLFGIAFFIRNYFLNKSISKSHLFIIMILSSLILLLNNYVFNSSVSMAQGNFSDPITFYLNSIFGFFFIFTISKFLQILNNKIYKIIEILGQNTIGILGLHLLIFKIINFAIVKYYKFDEFWISAFPTLYGMSIENDKHLYIGVSIGIIYLITGVFVPLVFSLGFKQIKHRRMMNGCINRNCQL